MQDCDGCGVTIDVDGPGASLRKHPCEIEIYFTITLVFFKSTHIVRHRFLGFGINNEAIDYRQIS